MRSSLALPGLSVVTLLAVLGGVTSCSDDTPGPGASVGGGGGGGAGGMGAQGGVAGQGGASPPTLGPGEVCAENVSFPTLGAKAPWVAVQVGKTRTVELIVRPDLCQQTPLVMKLGDGSKAQIAKVGGAVPASPNAGEATAQIDLRHPTISVEVSGVAVGVTTLEASFTVGDKTASLSLPVHVMDGALPSCGQPMVAGQVTPGGKIGGAAVAGAELGLQAGADQPVQTQEEGITVASPVLWVQPAFDATVGCAADIVPAGHVALGPAVTFGPAAKVFAREVPMAIPINPALMTSTGKARHVRIAYSGPAFKAPRAIPVADLKVEPAEGGGWVARFLAPRLGTYQAVVASDAGTRTFKRKLTHRAVIGISMGGGGAAMVGTRYHDKFDVLAPLGGPVDWTYMLEQIERNHVAGFLPNDGVTKPSGFAPLAEPRVTYEHPSSYNAWWYEYPRKGNGGTFSRGAYTQIFRDLSLMFGNPNGENKAPNAEHLPPGVDPAHPAVRGDVPEGDCSVAVETYEEMPNLAKYQALSDKCGASRCANTQVLTNFYDGRYNPKGTWPVITVCDGGPQDKSKSPYANQWSPQSNTDPLEVALAVDYNGNGKRDLDEPIISQGHEPFDDVGVDGVPSTQEAGYVAGENEDPAGDDYDPQYNPGGTERNGRHDEGEPFQDVGLDGVDGTAASPYDVGEKDGQFTASRGLRNFYDHDPHGIVHRWVTPPAGVLDDAALQRLDLWTDGGYRDLFNFAAAGQYLVGAFGARGRNVAYYSSPAHIPGQPANLDNFDPVNTLWDSVPGSVLMRYGAIDPTVKELNDGAGQHVGSVSEVTARLQGALHYIGQRWPDAPRTLVEKSINDPNPGTPSCEITGSCTFTFKDSRGREGPVTINLPPGYGHKAQQGTRYPVIFMLHGYGQSPQDLGAAIVFLNVWMNQSIDSSASRLSKAIMVYVDGRCRLDAEGNPECIRGTFYADSPRATGAKQESWMLELMSHVDKNYRTMGESEVDWPAD